MTSTLPRRIPLLAALPLLLGGCSSDRGVLARVAGEPITVERLTEVGRANPQMYADVPDSAKARLLNDLIQRELMVQAARREGLHETPGYLAYRLQIERQLQRETLFQRLLGGPAPVSEAEIAELHRRRATATRARLILTYDEPQVRQVLAELAAGAEFAAVADRYNPTGTIPPGGDLGFVQAGSLLPPLDDVVRTGALRTPLGPLRSGDAWFVLWLEERRAEEPPPLEQVRAELDGMLRQGKQRAAAMRVVERLRAEHRVAMVPGAAHRFMERFRTPPSGDGMPAPPEPPGAEERDQVLARYREGVYTMGDAYDDLVNGTGPRPNLSMLSTIQSWIESQTVERAALAEARTRRILDEPQVRRRLQDRADNYLLDQYYQAHVMRRISLGPDQVRAAYERFRESFARLESARVVTVTLRDSADAAALAEQVLRAPDLREAAAVAGTGRMREERPRFPADSPLWTRFEGQLAAMSPREIAGPYPVEGGWLIFQLIEKRQESPRFETLPPGALAQLEQVVMEANREARLAVLTDSLRAAFAPIEVHADRLRRVLWPPEGAGPPGM